MEDLDRAASLLIEALSMRRRYMEVSGQSFPSDLASFLSALDTSKSPGGQISRNFSKILKEWDCKILWIHIPYSMLYGTSTLLILKVVLSKDSAGVRLDLTSYVLTCGNMVEM